MACLGYKNQLRNMLNDDHIIIVTGLPRSGTTLLMRMLEAGGIPLYYDNSKPVEFTEKGVKHLNHNVILRETDKIKDLKTGDDSWLEDCYGMAVKVLTPSRVILPKGHRYKFIWCDRKFKHMAKSFEKYTVRSKQRCPSKALLIGNFRAARTDGKRMLKNYPDSDFMEVHFEKVLKRPYVVAIRLEEFLGIKFDRFKVASVVVDRPASCMPYMMEERIYLDGNDRV